MSPDLRENKKLRWYFAAMAASGATCFTHPIELLKVLVITEQEKKLSALQLTGKIIRERGILILYNGFSASLLRATTYWTVRSGIYEMGKYEYGTTFSGKVLLAGVSGAAGGFVATPTDMINARMENDAKLPPEQRRNYKHAIDGLIRVHREEGFRRLFSGATAATVRGFLLTIGQIAFYDQVKSMLLDNEYFKDNVRLHFVASLVAGAVATTLTQPLDVIKTRSMTAEPGKRSSLLEVVLDTAQLGRWGFYRGFLPAFLRLTPHTMITYIFLEQLRLNFGIRPADPIVHDPQMDALEKTIRD